MVTQKRVDQYGYLKSRKEALHIGRSTHCTIDVNILVYIFSYFFCIFRTGTLEPGDVLLAIDGKNLEGATLQHAVELLKSSGDVVTLQISKDTATLGPPGTIVFTVELMRRGASLGITVHGKSFVVFWLSCAHIDVIVTHNRI